MTLRMLSSPRLITKTKPNNFTLNMKAIPFILLVAAIAYVYALGAHGPAIYKALAPAASTPSHHQTK
ncbi:hypothetical protein UFOVP1118_46 [uncultured Caudovirales phage]|uniref:Uncharacterized protein n=1 Tax=uncultured Caudovirales phage TaxID=2100421 RepID=A0A6J5QRK6_9CAUD|nr:hypothetical protein UFOVP1118_46 [uncultured Caudovirales phage]